MTGHAPIRVFKQVMIMIYGYIRVSTDRQSVANQKFEIEQFCKQQKLAVDGWIEETISGTEEYEKRRLGRLLRRVHAGDMIVCSELSRLGRSLFMIMEILSVCMNKGCRVWTIKEGYRLGEDLQSKVLAFAFGLSAEIERTLISQRTREALARRRDEGQKLGRPVGSRNAWHKLDGMDVQVIRMWEESRSYSDVARKTGVSRKTVKRWLDSRMQA